jgi:hypothetical protein
LSLRPLPSAIGKRVFNSHFRTPQRGDDHSETAVFDDIGSSGLRVLRRYCPRCGSPLTTELALTPDLLMVKAGSIDSNEWFHPVWELFVGRRRPWVSPVPAPSNSKAILRSRRGPK